MSAAADASKSSIRQISELELVSRRIDKIVDAITTVSIQTNMLAVNGSVESARAGEFGKGFAVVSTDIRNLARDSAENADRIKDLVKAVQDQIGIVGRDLDEIVAPALSEVEKAKVTTANWSTSRRTLPSWRPATRRFWPPPTRSPPPWRGEDRRRADRRRRPGGRQGRHQAATAAKQQAQGAEELAAAIEEIASLADELQSA